MKVHIGLECHLRRIIIIWRNILGSEYLLTSTKLAAFTSRYAEIVMKICSPYDVTLFNSTELCNELSHAASKRNMQRSSPGISRYSPGKSPSDSTELSLSSSSGSGVFLMRPEHKHSLLEVFIQIQGKQQQYTKTDRFTYINTLHTGYICKEKNDVTWTSDGNSSLDHQSLIAISWKFCG